METDELEKIGIMFRDRIDSLENDTRRCFWPMYGPADPGVAWFPPVMYGFATLDYFSSFWAGWNQRAPAGRNQTDRMSAFATKYLSYGWKESQIAVHLWRHKLMHTGEPRLLCDAESGESYIWALSVTSERHMLLQHTGAKDEFVLFFNPVIFGRDLRIGVFGQRGYYNDLIGNLSLQHNFGVCMNEFKTYKIKLRRESLC